MVTPLVNDVRSPTTLLEKFWIPPTMDAAKSAPGRVGIEMLPPPEDPWADVDGTVLGPSIDGVDQVGSNRPHQVGT